MVPASEMGTIVSCTSSGRREEGGYGAWNGLAPGLSWELAERRQALGWA